MSKFTLEVQQDENVELFFEFPDDLLNQMGWNTGDTLTCEDIEGGSWMLTKEDSEDE